MALNSGISSHSPTSFVPAAVAGLAMLLAALFGVLAPRSDAGGRVAAIFPPWWDARDVMAGLTDADASILRQGAIPAVVLLSSDRPGLPQRLRQAGALLIVDPKAAAGCLGLDDLPATG